MRKELFRKEAIDQQTQTALGTLLMAPRPFYLVGACMITLWIVAVVAYLSSNNYARKAPVKGWLEPNSGVFKLYSEARSGKVVRLFVEDGDEVKKGEPLAHIDYGQSDTRGNSVTSLILEELSAKQTRTKQSLERLASLHSNELGRITAKLTRSKDIHKDMLDILSLAATQQEMTEEHLATAKVLLDQGFVTESEVENHQLQVLSAKQQYIKAQQEAESQEAVIADLEQEVAALPEHYANEKSLLENTLSDLNQQIVTHNSNNTQVLYAPHDGVVSGLQIKQGHLINSAALLLTLLPQDASVLARIVVPVRSSGFISEGQPLHIRYDAFPYQKFGLQPGRVVKVSNSIVLPGEVINSPVAIDEPAYLVTATLDNDAIIAYGKEIALKAGMTFSADVHLSQRTLLEWLLEPLYSIKGSI